MHMYINDNLRTSIYTIMYVHEWNSHSAIVQCSECASTIEGFNWLACIQYQAMHLRFESLTSLVLCLDLYLFLLNQRFTLLSLTPSCSASCLFCALLGLGLAEKALRKHRLSSLDNCQCFFINNAPVSRKVHIRHNCNMAYFKLSFIHCNKTTNVNE